jgi:type IV secretion system protein VirB7
MRTTSIVIVALATALAGCASAGGSNAPVCDGKHRRPANLHGSVLDPAATPASPAKASEPAAAAPVHPSCGQ